MAGGRPTLYTQEILDKTDSYLEQCTDNEYSFVTLESKGATGYKESITVKLPTIEGLALFLGVSRAVIYEWEKLYPEFNDKVTRVRNLQAVRLIEGALSGKYKERVAALLLSSAHGYREGKDITTNGKDLPTPLVDLTALTKQPIAEVTPSINAQDDEDTENTD